MNSKAKHAHGSRSKLDAAISSGLVDKFDVLFLSGENENPAIGWVDRNGQPIIIDTENVVVIEDEVLPESGKMGKIYIFNNEGYFWSGTEFVSLSKPTDLTNIQTQLDSKADVTTVNAALQEVNEKIAETETAMEVVEF